MEPLPAQPADEHRDGRYPTARSSLTSFPFYSQQRTIDRFVTLNVTVPCRTHQRSIGGPCWDNAAYVQLQIGKRLRGDGVADRRALPHAVIPARRLRVDFDPVVFQIHEPHSATSRMPAAA